MKRKRLCYSLMTEITDAYMRPLAFIELKGMSWWRHQMETFPRYWPFVRGIPRSPVKGQWRGDLVFSLIRAWINAWVNNREAGDLRCHRAHYDVIVMHTEVIAIGQTLSLHRNRDGQLYIRFALQWRHNGRDGVSNHQPRDCFLNSLFRHWSKKTLKFRVTGLCAGNSPEAGEFPAQMASNAENVSIWWRHHAWLTPQLLEHHVCYRPGPVSIYQIVCLIENSHEI